MHKSDKYQLSFTILIIAINLCTFFYVHPLRQNLSDLGNALGHRGYLILWGCSAAIYFYIYTMQYIKKSGLSHPLIQLFLLFACCCMILSVCIPYLPAEFPLLSKWHTRIAMLGTVLYVLIMFYLLCESIKMNYSFFQTTFYPYCLLVAFDLLLYLLNGGVSTLLEVTFTIGMSIYLYWIKRIM